MGYEIDFLPVGKENPATLFWFGTATSMVRGSSKVVLVDAGYPETGRAVVEHLKTYYGTGWRSTRN